MIDLLLTQIAFLQNHARSTCWAWQLAIGKGYIGVGYWQLLSVPEFRFCRKIQEEKGRNCSTFPSK